MFISVSLCDAEQAHPLDDDTDDDIVSAHQESTALTLAEINEICETRIRQVQEIVELSADVALMVLLSHEWNIDKCLTELTEGHEGVVKQVAMPLPCMAADLHAD
jgi:hypothetical protein